MKRTFNRIFIEGFQGMAYGLFATLILGIIFQQTGTLIGGRTGTLLFQLGKFAASITGAGIGIGLACRLNEGPLEGLSAAVAGMVGAFASEFASGSVFIENGSVVISGSGEPLGAFVAALAAIELCRLIDGKINLDILLAPMAGIIGGSLVGLWIGPPINRLMTWLGSLINWGTQQQPLIMGIVVSVLMGMMITLPVSSAAIGIFLNLSGLAAGAATIGCCCNMIGFAVASYRENGVSGLITQGIGTSMLQFPNIIRRPLIWLPPILSSAILGPIGVMLIKVTNSPAGSGMGSIGLTGQVTTWQAMTPTEDPVIVLLKIVTMHFLFPGLLTLVISNGMRKLNLIKPGDMSLEI